jgi:hypothetical protein
MVTYLLLRDNKQLGPLTLDEVIQLGLKGYDLVWVEGRSAAWRYPSEIEELKSFAPIVEEQPFDRFYKRPAAAENKNIPKEITPVKTEPAPVVSHEKQYASISRGDNKVYVTLPARTAAIASTPSIKKTVVEEVKPAIIQERFFAEEKFANPAGFGNEFLQHDVVEKNQRVEKTQQPNISTNKKILKPALMLLGVFVLLGCGILIGLYINKSTVVSTEKIKETANQQTVPAKEQQTNPPVVPVSDKLVDNNQANNSAIENTVKQPDNTIENKNVTASQTDIQNIKKEITPVDDKKKEQKTKNILPKKIPILSQSAATDTNSDYYQKTGVARRSSTHRDDEISDKAVLKTNIADMVGLSANTYSVGTFGGISNLQITVSNHSVYPLDLVVVEVQYVQANKKIFKTENIYFHNVGAGSALMQEAPKSPRGIKVQYKIAVINSKDSGLSYSGN